MNRHMVRTALAAMVMLAAGCGMSPVTRTISDWASPPMTAPSFGNILVVAMAEKDKNRTMCEKVFIDRLQKKGTAASPSSSLIPADRFTDRAYIKSQVDEGGFDSVLVIRLIRMEKDLDYSPPEVYYDTFNAPDLYSFEPQSYSRSRTITIKTTLYDIKSGSKIWTLTTETSNPPTARSLARSLSKTVADLMDEKGFIRIPAAQE